MRMHYCLAMFLLLKGSSGLAYEFIYPDAVFMRLASDTFSDAAPIEQMLHDLKGKPVRSGEFAYTHNQLELGVEIDAFEISYLARYDYFLEFSDDTVRLAYIKKNDSPANVVDHYAISLYANHMRTSGLAIAYRFTPAENHALRLKLSYLKATETTLGKLKGRIETRDTDFSADLYLDYSYTEDAFLNRPREQVDGRGATLDVDWHWRVNEDFTFNFAGRDLISLIRFDDITFTRATATTNRISFDSDGTLTSIPALSGVERYRDEIQRFPRRITATGSYRCGEIWVCRAELFAIDRYRFPRLGVERTLPTGILALDYDLGAKALGVRFSNRLFSLQLRTDHTNWDEMDKLELAVQFHWRL